MAEQKELTAMEAYKKVKLRKLRYVLYKIKDSDSREIVVADKGTRDQNSEDFMEALPENACRYAVYDYEFRTKDNRKTSKLYFLFWSPDTAHGQALMMYAKLLPDFKNQMTGILNVEFKEMEDVEDFFDDENTE